MLHSQFFVSPAETRWRGTTKGNRLDCETGVLLRQTLAPVFSQSRSWSGLRRRLRIKGFDLGFYEGRLILVDMCRGERICSCKFLGHPLKSLTARLGRVRAKAPRGNRAFGHLVA